MAESGIEIRKLNAEDAQSFWQLRREGLELEPQAFTESVRSIARSRSMRSPGV